MATVNNASALTSMLRALTKGHSGRFLIFTYRASVTIYTFSCPLSLEMWVQLPRCHSAAIHFHDLVVSAGNPRTKAALFRPGPSSISAFIGVHLRLKFPVFFRPLLRLFVKGLLTIDTFPLNETDWAPADALWLPIKPVGPMLTTLTYTHNPGRGAGKDRNRFIANIIRRFTAVIPSCHYPSSPVGLRRRLPASGVRVPWPGLTRPLETPPYLESKQS